MRIASKLIPSVQQPPFSVSESMKVGLVNVDVVDSLLLLLLLATTIATFFC